MKNLTIKHYLEIYRARKEMQEKGITQPSEKYKKFTVNFVEKLQTYSLNEEIILDENECFFDNKGNVVMETPN